MGNNKVNNVLADNKCVTRFFQRKAFPPACDLGLQFNFKKPHIAGSVNTVAGLKNREDIHTVPIEVTTSSSDVADEEQFFFTQADVKDEAEEQTIRTKRTISTKFEAMGSK